MSVLTSQLIISLIDRVTEPARHMIVVCTSTAAAQHTPEPDTGAGESSVFVALPPLILHRRFQTTLSIHAPRQRHDIESLTKVVLQVQEAAKRLEMLNRS